MVKTSGSLFLGASLFALSEAATASKEVQAAGSSCAVPDYSKSDCGYWGIDQGSCEAKGCCWSPAGTNSATPWCFHPQKTTDGYSLSKLVETPTGYAAELSLIGEGSAAYGPDIKRLSLEVVFEAEDTLRVKITDAARPRWEVPEVVLPRPHATQKPAASKLKFSYTEAPFSFEITRAADGKSLFKLGDSFTFKDQYLEVPTAIDERAKTFGLGESARLHHALQSGHTYTMWAADIPAIVMDKNLYGSYPFYLQVLDGQAHGVMLLNSNGMDVSLQQRELTFKAIGGVVDLYVFNGPTPADVVRQYTAVVGRPAMQAYWSLGFHNCKYGYKSISEVKEVVQGYKNANIPLDTQWVDIDYMQDYRDFTLDRKNFPADEVKPFVDELHANGQHFVPIIDPGIMVFPGYEAYERGVKENLFVKDLKGNDFLGQVWPGPTTFPDFFHPKAQSYWTDQLKSFHDIVPVDGIWIDMNEISNFCNGDGTGQVCVNSAPEGCPAPGASQTDCCLVCSQVDSNSLDFPPYNINNGQGRLSAKTVAVSATQYGNISMYDAHNLYGLTEQIATKNALVDIRGKRPFLLTRSSFLSSGAHTAKWTGDNGATWDDLKSSIVSIMDFNLFGVPMIGADICGFIFDTTEELCARWIEVGAFYPFSRNHNTLGAMPQELYLWNSVSEAARNALGMRYQLLPYFYSLFYNAHTQGDMVVRPLWGNFPSDDASLSIDRQFMVGDAVLISPVLDAGVNSVRAYFPPALWYSFAQRSLAIDASAGGVWQTLPAALTEINVHVKGGSVLPLQQPALTTTAGRETPFTLFAALCANGGAKGELFWDDGEQVQLSQYLKTSFKAKLSSESLSAGSFSATVEHNNYAGATQAVKDVVIAARDIAAPAAATLNGVPLSADKFSFDAAKKTLTFRELGVKIGQSFTIEWK